MKFSTYKTMLDESQKNILVTDSVYDYITDNLSSPDKVVYLMNDLFNFNKLAEEYIYMIAFNTKMKVLGIFELGHGTCNLALFGARELLIRALLCGASTIIITHNHPSGVCEPSYEDIKVTRKIKDACAIVGIPLSDHIIIGGTTYYSFKEKNNVITG